MNEIKHYTLSIRFPIDLAEELQKRAERNERSMNKEVVYLLKAQVTAIHKKKNSTPDSAA